LTEQEEKDQDKKKNLTIRNDDDTTWHVTQNTVPRLVQLRDCFTPPKSVYPRPMTVP